MGQNVFLITGTDEGAIDHAAEQIVAEHAGDAPDAFSLDTIRDGDEIGAADAVNQTVSSALSPPFFGGRKTVWLRRFPAFRNEGAKGSTGGIAGALERLSDMIRKGVAEDIVLVLSGPSVDKRKRLYKACESCGTVTECLKPDVKDRNWRDQVRRRVLGCAAEKQLSLPPEAADYLTDVLGTDTDRIENEIEKLVAYAGGPGGAVTCDDVQELCHGEGAAISWSLRDAIGSRNLSEALRLIDVLLQQEREPDGAVIGLVIQTANHVRNLLQMRVLMQTFGIRGSSGVERLIKNMDKAKQAQLRQEGLEVATFHPYRALLLAQQAVHYRGSELVEAICILRDTFHNCVSASIPNRVEFERALTAICSPRSR